MSHRPLPTGFAIGSRSFRVNPAGRRARRLIPRGQLAIGAARHEGASTGARSRSIIQAPRPSHVRRAARARRTERPREVNGPRRERRGCEPHLSVTARPIRLVCDEAERRGAVDPQITTELVRHRQRLRACRLGDRTPAEALDRVDLQQIAALAFQFGHHTSVRP